MPTSTRGSCNKVSKYSKWAFFVENALALPSTCLIHWKGRSHVSLTHCNYCLEDYFCTLTDLLFLVKSFQYRGRSPRSELLVHDSPPYQFYMFYTAMSESFKLELDCEHKKISFFVLKIKYLRYPTHAIMGSSIKAVTFRVLLENFYSLAMFKKREKKREPKIRRALFSKSSKSNYCMSRS